MENIKVNAIKDGKGNIVISEDSFEMLLACLDNQKFVGESPQNADSLSVGEDKYWKGQEDIQNTIDQYNRQCRDILHQKYVFSLSEDGYYLSKRYEYQSEDTEWTGEDVGLVYELFKDTRIIYPKRDDLIPLDGTESIKEDDEPIGKTLDGWIAVEPEPRPWLIERPIMYDGQYLTISEDGFKNRPWKSEEVENITNLFNGNYNKG
jgi:hypothetical protein